MRGNNAGPILWEDFSDAFLDNLFPRELKKAKAKDLVNLKQGKMSVKKYVMKFSQLSLYTL